jgi:hypothetical protein
LCVIYKRTWPALTVLIAVGARRSLHT